jgi:hypothetical protein
MMLRARPEAIIEKWDRELRYGRPQGNVARNLTSAEIDRAAAYDANHYPDYR